MAHYGTDYNKKLLDYYTLKSNESSVIIEQELNQIENYYRQLQMAQGNVVSSSKSRNDNEAMAAASFDAWSNANIDQDHSKVSSQ